MNAQLKEIAEQVIERPAYDNRFLGYEYDWIKANHPLLRGWWEMCERTLGEVLPSDDFEIFCRAQHEAQLTVRDDYRNTLRQF